MLDKIVLGTTQFGMEYGINNRRGRIPEGEVFEILNEVSNSGLCMLDTAYAYGDGEILIGNFVKESICWIFSS